jgi:hypothetical protein
MKCCGQLITNVAKRSHGRKRFDFGIVFSALRDAVSWPKTFRLWNRVFSPARSGLMAENVSTLESRFQPYEKRSHGRKRFDFGIVFSAHEMRSHGRKRFDFGIAFSAVRDAVSWTKTFRLWNRVFSPTRSGLLAENVSTLESCFQPYEKRSHGLKHFDFGIVFSALRDPELGLAKLSLA